MRDEHEIEFEWMSLRIDEGTDANCGIILRIHVPVHVHKVQRETEDRGGTNCPRDRSSYESLMYMYTMRKDMMHVKWQWRDVEYKRWYGIHQGQGYSVIVCLWSTSTCAVQLQLECTTDCILSVAVSWCHRIIIMKWNCFVCHWAEIWNEVFWLSGVFLSSDNNN